MPVFPFPPGAPPTPPVSPTPLPSYSAGDATLLAGGPQMLAFPFRLQTDGTVAKVEQGSPQGLSEHVLHLVATRPGERVLVPGFGLEDPAFVGFSAGDLVAQVAIYGPPVTITNVTAAPAGQHTQRVEVLFNV
jgi:hypothetical protein